MNTLSVKLTQEVFARSKSYYDAANCPIAVAVGDSLKRGYVAIVGGYDVAIYIQREEARDKKQKITLDKVAECYRIPEVLRHGAKTHTPAEAMLQFDKNVELFVKEGCLQ